VIARTVLNTAGVQNRGERQLRSLEREGRSARLISRSRKNLNDQHEAAHPDCSDHREHGPAMIRAARCVSLVRFLAAENSPNDIAVNNVTRDNGEATWADKPPRLRAEQAEAKHA
jgi:hypothetical protein